MKSLLLFVIVGALFYFMANPYFYQYLNAVTDKKIPKQTAVLVTAVLFALLVVMIDQALSSTKEDFFFEVSPNLPRCAKGFVGRPGTFQYSSDADRFGDWNRTSNTEQATCNKVDKEAQKSTFGRDGFLGTDLYGTYYDMNDLLQPIQ